MELSEAAKTALLGSGAHLPQGTPLSIQFELRNARMATPYGVLTARGMDTRDEILNERLNKLDVVTPAEERTGVSDRKAAALDALDKLTSVLRTVPGVSAGWIGTQSELIRNAL